MRIDIDERLTVLELFGGIGGFSRAIADHFPNRFRVTNYCDVDESAISVYSHHYPDVRIHRDIRAFGGEPGQWDVIVGGFPCTGTSRAGKRQGLNHPASSLWRHMLRIISVSRPRFAVIEQPESIRYTNPGLLQIVDDLDQIGYMGEWECVSAAQFGAPHLRERLFVVAYPNHVRDRLQEREATGWFEQIGADIAAISDARGVGYPGFTPAPADAYSKQWLDCSESGARSQPQTNNPTRDRARRECQPSGVGLDDGIPPWLRGIDFDAAWNGAPPLRPGIPGKKIPGRRACITLYGRAVTPKQAAIPLRRVLYLDSLLRA